MCKLSNSLPSRTRNDNIVEYTHTIEVSDNELDDVDSETEELPVIEQAPSVEFDNESDHSDSDID